MNKWNPEIGATTTDGYLKCKPINIVRTPFDNECKLYSGDTLQVTIDKNSVKEAKTPAFTFDHSFIATHVVKFEVLDEFNFDVGIGFIIGGRRIT